MSTKVERTAQAGEGLIDLLECGIAPDRWQALHMLRAPWCQPRDDLRLERVRAAGWSEPPSEPEIGETLLVTVSDSRWAGLWRATTDRDHSGRPLVGEAAKAATWAARIAARDVPVIGAPPRLSNEAAWVAAPVASNRVGRMPPAIDGASVGLALGLGAASLLVDRPLPAGLVALAAVGNDGALGPIDALEAKLGVVARWALAVSRVLVHPEQSEFARQIARALGAEWTIVPVGDVRAAVRVAYPDIEAIGAWESDPAAREALRLLVRQALRNECGLLGWKAVAETGRKLCDRFADDDRARSEAELVAAIADRHEGKLSPIPWPDDSWLAEHARPVRLEIVSHVLQSAADCMLPDVEQTIAKALAMVHRDVNERCAEELDVLGAAARAWSSLGPRGWERGLDLARQAVVGWWRLLRPEGSTRSLSELLRLTALLGRRGELETLLETTYADLLAEPRVAPHGLAFVAFAAGRAACIAGDSERALALFESAEVPWELIPDHLRWARERWLGRVYAALGKRDDARRCRHNLENALATAARPDPNLLLARLDEALETGADLSPHFAALLDHPERAEFQCLLAASSRDEEGARFLSNAYRY